MLYFVIKKKPIGKNLFTDFVCNFLFYCCLVTDVIVIVYGFCESTNAALETVISARYMQIIMLCFSLGLLEKGNF